VSEGISEIIRMEFERFISSPPFERLIVRHPDDTKLYSWPGTYKDYIVELAWEAYQSGLNAGLRKACAIALRARIKGFIERLKALEDTK